MSELLSFYKLCPITNDILGVSEDADRFSVICTLGKKIVYIIQLNCQKQLKSWSTSDNFSSKVIYDFKMKKYVGLFSKLYVKLWDNDTEDINKVKRVKLLKPVHEINIFKVNGAKTALVVYEDGSCESLASALESRAQGKANRDEEKINFKISNVQLTNGIFSYVKETGSEKHFCYTTLEETSSKSLTTLKSFKLDRMGQDAQLMGLTVVQGKTAHSDPALITIWSDKRLFKQVISPSESYPSIGALHSIVDSISGKSRLEVTPISEDCIAIYASKSSEDGSSVLLYNIKYKIIQSKVPFKVYLSNFKLWSVRKNIFLAMGEQLSVIPFRVSIDRLSNLVGSQSDSNVQTTVEKEMINEDMHYEENLEFDEDQTPVEGMEFRGPVEQFYKSFPRNLSGAKPIADANKVEVQLNDIIHDDLAVDVVRMDDQPSGTVNAKLLSNVDEAFPILSENFDLMCGELEKFGCSEIEITSRVIPILLKTNRTEDIGLMLKKYNHISEKMLTKIIKFLLSCPIDDDALQDSSMMTEDLDEDSEINKTLLCKEKRFKNTNALLSTIQNENRDVLSIALCCSYDSQTILPSLRSDITLPEMVKLMDHLYKILTTSSLDDPFDMRGNLVEGADFDLDTNLFEWFKLLLDSHYQQILLSHDSGLYEKLELWLHLIDDHIKILSEMNDMRQILLKLSTKKPIQLSKQCNQWYTIEQLQLY